MKEYILTEEDLSSMQLLLIDNFKELVRCKDCKHRPRRSNVDDEHEGLNLEFPDEKCPCQCEDPWYNWMPRDDWHCGSGERKRKKE